MGIQINGVDKDDTMQEQIDGKLDTIDDKVDTVDSNVDTINTNVVSIKENDRNTLEVAVITAANSAVDTVLATVADDYVAIEKITVVANTAQTADMTSIAIKGGASKVITFIDAASGVQANLDAEDKQLTWEGSIALNVADTIVMEHVGTDVTPLDLTVIITYFPISGTGSIA
jgi:hypothetical protein